MARQKKDAKHVTYFISVDILEQLDKYYEETGVPKTTIVEKALKAYLDKKKTSDEQ